MKKLLTLAILAVVAVTSCGNTDSALVVYSGRTENLVGPLFVAFTVETGIEVDVRYAPSADLALLIDQEGAKTPADVFISQSPGAIGILAEQGLLAELSQETLELVPAVYRNNEGLWVGLSGRVRVLVYNNNFVAEDELPSSVFSLTDPAYRDRVAVAPANGSFQDFVTGLREIHGDDTALDWLGAMKANDVQTYANNSAIVQAVGRGEVHMGLVNHYYNVRALAEDPSLSSVNHYFDDVGSLLVITAAGVLQTSDRSQDGETLLQFLLNADSQGFLTTETFEYPLGVDSRPSAELPALADIKVVTYDFTDLSGGLSRTKELIDASGLEAP
jgi:iron(III) transport system substrate-binding protein